VLIPIGTSFLFVKTTYDLAGSLRTLLEEMYESLTGVTSLPLSTILGVPEK
jgi:hypothetical protein